MKKKEALLLLLQNSLMVSDGEKKKIYNKMDSLSAEQIDALGTLLSYEQIALIDNKEILLKQTQLLMNILELVC